MFSNTSQIQRQQYLTFDINTIIYMIIHDEYTLSGKCNLF